MAGHPVHRPLPKVDAICPFVERLGRVGGFDGIITLLQTGIDEISGHVGNFRIFEMFGINHCHTFLAGKGNEVGIDEGRIADLNRVAQGEAGFFFGKSSRKAPKSSASNFFVGANCQISGPSRSPSSAMPDLMKC